MRYVELLGLDLLLGVLILLVAGAAAYAATLAARDAPGAQPAPKLVRLLLAGLAGLLLARAATGLALGASYDWSFASRRLLLDLPLVAVPAALALLRARGGVPLVACCTAATGAAVAVVDALAVPRILPTAALVAAAATGPLLVLRRPADNRRHARVTVAVLAVPVLVLVAVPATSWWSSRLPTTYDLAAYAPTDAGGGHDNGHGHGHGDGHVVAHPVTVAETNVADLRGPDDEEPDVRVALTAARLSVERPGARPRKVLAFNGSIPGPVLRATEGDLVEVTLTNADVADGVTLHWHGVDVPNAEDGVAGVTQDAVPPGQRHVYRFRAEQTGSYWYHSHQRSSVQVEQGLYGALVIEPRAPLAAGTLDLAVVDHAWRGPQGFAAGGVHDASARVERHDAAPGTRVRLRVVNTDSEPHRYRLDGAPFRVAAVDGTEIVEPGLVSDHDLRLAGGGRYDLAFQMPAGPVTLHGLGGGHRLVLGAGPTAAAASDQPLLDLASYGSPTATPFTSASTFDREFTVDIDRQVGFQNGRLGWYWTVNGHAYPRLPMFVVRRGDLVRVTIVNRSAATHPMHLHGHHVLVLSRNGRAATGSPWWSDTLDVAPGERYEVALRADNPGIWMNHCHDLGHAADGFVMHLAYEGVSTPYVVGGRAVNQPE